ncbi:mannosyl-oligosaccharide 1,2-alpha-mannosidase precursor [Lojkania enalia]|uniref:alpha-1,2-Mannosidase n=1 Tax=Lojkania enalia TaxID=147567 RepID=A0A9P4K329_9PLEO|nr:mannosyl-oligosaccharide 1,2-alpha-mannosidase precursor [Didymosphaeria enalia]
MVRIKSLILAALSYFSSALSLPGDTSGDLNVSKKRYDSPSIDERAQVVVDAFRMSWEGYYKYAFPHDELRPITNTARDSRNGWGASAVDALSTALVMGQKDIVNQILDHIPNIDYTTTSTDVSLFETTIRYLGGMISGYDFLTGPLDDLADKVRLAPLDCSRNPEKSLTLHTQKENVDALLAQSKNLANALSYGFETPSGIPYNLLNFANRSYIDEPNGLATVGTLILEWKRLADLSGNQTYASIVEKAESYLLRPMPASSEPWPGLLGFRINVTNGEFLDARGGWGGGTDSFYEYLIKMFVYDPEHYSEYRDRWILAADSSIAHLASHPEPRPDITFLASYDGQNIIQSSSHLACFDGGNFILGGLVLKNQTYINFGLELVNGCHETYTATATQIGPEAFRWDPSRVPPEQVEFFQKNGFYISASDYILRPETIESYYYAYRATSDPKYQDWAWDAFVAITSTTKIGSAYCGIGNVNTPDGGGFYDYMESFWFAEVLKYSYLIFAEENDWQVAKDGVNKWVFNTEAHPFKVAGS